MSLIITIMMNNKVLANYGATRVTNTERVRLDNDEWSDYEITDIPNERVIGLISHRYGDGAHLLAAKIFETADNLYHDRKERS